MVGDDPASQIYVRNKRRCLRAGRHHLAAPTTCRPAPPRTELLALIALLNADPEIDGILVQLPLPAHIRTAPVVEAIDPAKDVDGFHPYKVGRLAQRSPLLRPCTPYGVMRLLAAIGVTGGAGMPSSSAQSNIVGRPMALELLLARRHRDHLPQLHPGPARPRRRGRHPGRRRDRQARTSCAANGSSPAPS